MLKKINKNTFSFSVKPLEEFTVSIQKDEISVYDNSGILKFNDIKQFRMFCNSITDIIEYCDSEGKNE